MSISTSSAWSSSEEEWDSETTTDSDVRELDLSFLGLLLLSLRESLCTLTESLAAALLVERGGKSYSAFSDDYRLPFDDTMRQAERLTQMMIDNWLGGYYEPEEESGYVANMLQKEGSRILDIGSGMEGLWLVWMAQRFPRSEGIGLDLTPTERSYTPSSVRYDVHDVTDGIPFPDEYFDLVQIRGTTPFIASLPDLLVHIRRVLKPGGVLIMIEHGCELHDHHGVSIEWFTISSQHALRADGELAPARLDPFKGHPEFLALKEIVESPGKGASTSSQAPGEGTEPDGFGIVYETTKDIHLGTREETDHDLVESQISIEMRAIVIAHWTVTMLLLDGTAAASEALQNQVAMLTERDSGLFQTCKALFAKKKGRPAGEGS